MCDILTAAFIVYGIGVLATSLHAFVTLTEKHADIYPPNATADLVTILLVGATWPLFWVWKLSHKATFAGASRRKFRK